MLVGRLVSLEFSDKHVRHLLLFLPINADLGSVSCHAPFSHVLRSQHLDPMDFNGVVRVHDKHVAERTPEEPLLIFVSFVLMQGNEVVKDPHDGIQEPGTELLHDRIQLEPRQDKVVDTAICRSTPTTQSQNYPARVRNLHGSGCCMLSHM